MKIWAFSPQNENYLKLQIMRKFLFFALIGVFTMSCDRTTLVSGTFGTQGDNLTWTLDDGVLTISGNGHMQDFRFHSVPWRSYRDVITTVIIGDGVANIGEMAFWECINLTSVTIGNSVEVIGLGAFGVSGLTSIVIPDNVTTIEEGAFRNCYNLTSVVIGDGVTTIGAIAFAFGGLESVVIGNSVVVIGMHAFAHSENLNSVTIGNSVKTIEEGVFRNCYNLTSIIIPNSVTIIEAGAFLNSGLTSVVIGDGVATIENSAFAGTALNSVTIPNSVTTIGNTVFMNCVYLTSVTIGSNVTTIGDAVFWNSTNLASITSYVLTPPILLDSWDLVNRVFPEIVLNSATLYVPAESIELYRNAHQWQDFQNIVTIQD